MSLNSIPHDLIPSIAAFMDNPYALALTSRTYKRLIFDDKYNYHRVLLPLWEKIGQFAYGNFERATLDSSYAKIKIYAASLEREREILDLNVPYNPTHNFIDNFRNKERAIDDENLLRMARMLKEKNILPIDTQSASAVREYLRDHKREIESTSHLLLSEAEMTRIPKEVFLFTALFHLDVSHNHIMHVPENLLTSCPALRECNICFNEILELSLVFHTHPFQMFDYRENLLSSTDIDEEDPNFSIFFDRLLSQDLLPKELKHIPNGRLYLRDIKEILYRIKRIDLSSSNLEKLPSELSLFAGLEELDLSNNHLTRVDASLFHQLKKLRNVIFLHNPIAKIDISLFSKCQQLETAIFSKNFFSDASIEAIQSCFYKKEVYRFE